MTIKVCGITRERDARLAAELGATAVGFVFWPGSARFIEPEEARRIRSGLPADVLAVGVFVNQPAAEVAEVASRVELAAIQLHGEETPADYASIGLPLIKAVRVGEGYPDIAPDALPPEVTVLIEGADRSRRGGAGVTADWKRAAAIAALRPAILAGGLTPDNVDQAIALVRPLGVDVSSGVESAPGVKDPERLRRFIQNAARALRGTEHL